MASADRFDNTFTNDVVRQASEWLSTNNILCTAMDQFHHLTGQKPSFTGLVSHGYDRGSHAGQI